MRTWPSRTGPGEGELDREGDQRHQRKEGYQDRAANDQIEGAFEHAIPPVERRLPQVDEGDPLETLRSPPRSEARLKTSGTSMNGHRIVPDVIQEIGQVPVSLMRQGHEHHVHLFAVEESSQVLEASESRDKTGAVFVLVHQLPLGDGTPTSGRRWRAATISEAGPPPPRRWHGAD